ncbi:MAG: alkaline phosphatase [Cyclobacteriaceae bacterium]
MQKFFKLWIVIVVLPVFSMANTYFEDDKPSKKNHYKNRNFHKIAPIEIDKTKLANDKVKNIIFFIGDGMGSAHVQAALTANKGELYMAQCPVSGQVTTHAFDNFITDSAAGGSAFSTGEKTRNGYIGLNRNGRRLPTIVELANKNGMATGIIATSKINHATPAAFMAHQTSRLMYEEIALDIAQSNVDVLIGGGSHNFSVRVDKRNLLEEMAGRGYHVIQNYDSLWNTQHSKIVALLTSEHLPRVVNRKGDELVNAVEKSIEVLSRNDKGFFMMVEGSQIDWASHDNNMAFIVEEMLEFDRAIGKALEFAAKDGETLVFITADHETGGLTLLDGNQKRGSVTGAFSTIGHTGVMVPSFAFGAGAVHLGGIIDNTDVFHIFKSLLGF